MGMEYTRMTDTGDGNRRADVGSAFNGTAVVPKTASTTISINDVGKVFSNAGAAGTVQLTLPVPKFGAWFGFAVTAAQTFEVLPNSGGKVNGGATKISAAGSQANVGYIELVCADGAYWFLKAVAGTWSTS